MKCGVKYLFGDCWVIFCLFQHQQQVVTAVERAKQVTMTELNAIVGVSSDVTALALSVSKFNLLSIINEFSIINEASEFWLNISNWKRYQFCSMFGKNAMLYKQIEFLRQYKTQISHWFQVNWTIVVWSFLFQTYALLLNFANKYVKIILIIDCFLWFDVIL